MRIRAIVLFICLGHTIAAAQTDPNSTVRCDGPGHTPILYDGRDFEPPALPIPPRERPYRLFLSDEESFMRRASSICVQSGFQVILYDADGESAAIDGPAELDLYDYGWSDRAESAITITVVIPESPPGQPTTPPQRPADATDYGGYESAAALVQEASTTNDCESYRALYAQLLDLRRSQDLVPMSVVQELRLGRPSVGEYARRNVQPIRRRRTEVCGAASSVPSATELETREFETRIRNMQRLQARALRDEDCEDVRESAEKIMAESDSSSASYALEFINNILIERADCF